ncbi:MAG: hypothetical protein JWM20_895 [Patescibacteria group bacterium]|nr:hypothetical protein [Patescibacteria group bacterium]
MNLNPKNWFELQQKRKAVRADLAKETGMRSSEALDKSAEADGMNDLLGAIASGNLANVSLDTGAVDGVAKSEYVRHLQETLRQLNEEAEKFGPVTEESVETYRQQSGEHYAYKKVNQELLKLDTLREETDRAIFEILKNGKGEGFTRMDEAKLAEYEKIKGAITNRTASLEQNPETALFVRMHTLDSYHDQLVKENYIETPSRTEYIDWIKDQMKNHRAVLLEGATGTGKTELLIHTSKSLLGKNNPEILAGNPHVTKYDLLGSQGLESDEHGTKTVDKPGCLPRAMKDGNLLILDEMNQIETKVRFALKPFYRYSGVRGGEVSVEGVNYPVNDGFLIAATANLKSEKHKDRFDLDAAESRVFAMKRIEYPPQNELYDMALAALRRNDGTYLVSEGSAKSTLKYLVDAARDIQEGYEKALSAGFDPSSGKKTSLEKAVLDPGEFMAMVKSYTASYASGKTFEDHIDARLADFVAKGSYPEKDRVLLAKILTSKGFLLKNFDPEMLHLTDDTLRDSLAQWPMPAQDTLVRERGTMTEREAAMLDPYELRKEMIAKTTDSFVGMIPEEEKQMILNAAERGINYLEAKEAIGKENFLGPDEIKFRFSIDVKNAPKVPFSKQELMDAKKLGQQLVLYVDKTKDGKPLTISAMREQTKNKTSQATGLFADGDDYFKNNGLDQETPRVGWRLTSKECLPNSENKNYFGQTQVAVDYLKNEVFKGTKIPKEYAEAFDEWEAVKKTNLKEQSESGDSAKWMAASQQLANLKITQLTRERLSEVMYRLAIQESKNKERLLDSAGRTVYYTWTSSRGSDGDLALAGRFDSDGVDVCAGGSRGIPARASGFVSLAVEFRISGIFESCGTNRPDRAVCGE